MARLMVKTTRALNLTRDRILSTRAQITALRMVIRHDRLAAPVQGVGATRVDTALDHLVEAALVAAPGRSTVAVLDTRPIRSDLSAPVRRCLPDVAMSETVKTRQRADAWASLVSPSTRKSAI